MKLPFFHVVKIVVILALLLISCLNPHEAARFSNDRKLKTGRMSMTSQDHWPPTPPIGCNPRTYIPTPPGRHC